MTIDYRLGKPSDLAALLPLVEGYARDQQQQVPINTLNEDFMEFARSGIGQALQHPAGGVMVAEETGDRPRLVGYAVGMIQEPPPIFQPEMYVFVSDLYVIPAYRRQGIGTALAERMRGWGWVNGVTRFSLVVPRGNVAEGIFEKLGFQAVQTMYYFKDKT